jgi:hypothetical protein
MAAGWDRFPQLLWLEAYRLGGIPLGQLCRKYVQISELV